MKTQENSSSKLCSSLSISLELEVAETLTYLANPLEMSTHLQADRHKSSDSFWSSGNIEASVQSSPLHLALWPDNKDLAAEVQHNGERESSMTLRKPIQAGEDAEFPPKTIQDMNVVPEDYVVEGQQDSEKECPITVTEPIQREENTEIQKDPTDGKSCAPHITCKSRRDLNRLTEDQKQARRHRRMLANRLSARQTILKRQARCDELAKKAAELQCENDNLKKEKEAAMREYASLKSTNKRLKAQLNMRGVTDKSEVEEEVDETQEGSKSDNSHTPTSPSLSTQQYFIFNQPSSFPFVLPYITPGSNIVPSAPQDGIFVASQAPVLANSLNCSLLEHENPLRMNMPGNTSYALPYHWFIPPMHPAERFPPQSTDLADKLNVTNQSTTNSYWKSIADIKREQRFTPKKMRGEASTSMETIMPSVQVHHGKGTGKKLANKPKVTSEAATASSSEGIEETVGCLRASQNDASNRRNEVATCAAATSSSSEENPQPPVDSLLRRWMGGYSAAAARKRRKEVIKMKNFQYSRQSRVRISSN
ncbi:BZIP domain-containing protein [Heracleum sosnowskyi]|uniref:BZIP domain-containing protein n=1 Tax=Heracleum sosnowskyi TaxID=360622 RepID=A0AAD8N2G4_9APIA|nr:BZIP domain-containing protein [Heracleum sosnowskyi]